MARAPFGSGMAWGAEKDVAVRSAMAASRSSGESAPRFTAASPSARRPGSMLAACLRASASASVCVRVASAMRWRSALRWERKTFAISAAMSTSETAASAATTGRRRAHRSGRRSSGGRRARMGVPSSHRPRSSAKSCAVRQRADGSFSKHDRQIVSRSRGTSARSLRGATGSRVSTCSSSSCTVAATNGARPVSAW